MLKLLTQREVEATKADETADSAGGAECHASSGNDPIAILAACSIPLLHVA